MLSVGRGIWPVTVLAPAVHSPDVILGDLSHGNQLNMDNRPVELSRESKRCALL